MDEFQIKVLEANGYSYVDGGIVDAEGNYISSVELNGELYNSESDQDLWNRGQALERKYSEPVDPYKNLKEFEKDPLNTVLTEEDRNFYPLYSEEQEENDIPTYDNVDIFQKEMEDKAIQESDNTYFEMLRQFQEAGHDNITDEFINENKRNESVIKKYQNSDKDVDTIMQDILDEGPVPHTPDPNDNAVIAYLKDPNRNVFTRMGDWMWERIYSGIAHVTPTGVGMDGTEEEIQEYKDAVTKRKELQTPVLEIVDSMHEQKQKVLQDQWDNMSFAEKYNPFDRENRLVEYGLGEVNAERDRIKDYVEGSHIYNPLNKDFLGDFATLGIGDAYDMYFYNSYLHDKINKGEELTEKEQLVAETLAGIHQSKGVKMDQKGLYNITAGTFESASFLLGGAPGRLALRGTTKAITRNVAKSLSGAGMSTGTANVFGKVAGETVNMFGQAVLHPDAHVKALNKYYGDIQFDKNDKGEIELTTDRRTYKTLMDEVEINRNRIEDALAKETDPEKIAQLKTQLNKIEDYSDSIKAPETVFDSAAYGLTEVLKENVIENYGGQLANKVVNNRFTKKLATKPWAQSIANSGVAQNIKKANNLFGSVKNKFNTLTGNKGSKLVGNNLEEMAEEVMTQLVPVWGETEEEAKQRKGELLEGSFYGQVAGQTLLMGGLMKALYSPLSGYQAYQKSKNLRDKRKAFKDMISDFNKENISDSQVEELLMSAGEGNFSIQEFDNKIAKLRDKGQHDKANELERNKVFNIGKSLVSIGRGKEFVRNMNNVISSGNVTPESIASIQEAVQEVKVLEADMKDHGNLKNRDYVLELKSKLRYNQKQKENLEKRKSELNGQEQSQERDAEVDAIDLALKDINNHEGQLKKAINHETSSKMVDKLRKEEEVTNSIIKEYRKLVKENDATDSSALRDKAIENTKQKYGKTISNGTYSKSIKDVDRYLLKETLREEIALEQKESKIEAQIEEVTPEKEETQKHVEEIGQNVDQVTELAEQQEISFQAPDNKKGVDDLDYAGPAFDPDVETDSFEDIDDAFFDDMPVQKDGSFENQAFNNLVETVKNRVNLIEKRDKTKPSFKDYVEDLIDNGDVPIENFRGHMRALALAWSGAKLGKTNWRQLYNELFEDTQAVLNRKENQNTSEAIKTPQIEEVQERSEEQVTNKNSLSEPIKYEETSGAPVHVTPNSNKTYGTEHKLNFSAIEYNEVIENVNGKKVFRKINSPIPKLNENSGVSFKDLVNPNKNNIGDKLFPEVLDGEDLANTSVAVRDKYGRQTGTITFAEWVEGARPEGMSFEAFQQTREYKDKVPMVYRDSQGTAVAYVPEVEWFSVTSVGDSTKDVDEVDLDNPSESLRKDIQQNREQASNLREEVINGTIEEVEIIDNLSFPPLQKIAKSDDNGVPIPTKSLSEVAPDSQIVWMKASGTIVDMNGRTIEMENILNLGDESEGFLMTKVIEEDGIKKKLPINRNRTHYLVHTATISGVKKYIALNVQRKNENGLDSAYSEDIETARWIAAINNVTKFHDTNSGSEILTNSSHPLHMSLEQAEDLRRQIKEVTGTDVKSKYTDLIEALIAYQTPDKDGQVGQKITFGSELSKILRAYNKDTGKFKNADINFRQNTSLRMLNKPMIKIAKTENGFVVEKIADSYDQHLKNRLSTNVMGYNVGTKENPVYTIAVQQKVKIRPLSTKKETLEEKVEENKQDTQVQEKVVEVETIETPGELTEDQKQKRKQLVEEATALAKELNLDIRGIKEIDDLIASELTTTENVDNSILITEGLTIKQEEDIIKWLFSKLANKETNFQEVKEDLNKEFSSKADKLATSISNLNEFKDNEVVDNLITTLESALSQIENALENSDSLLAEASMRAVNTSFITDEFEVDEINENIKDFSKASNENKPIDKVGTALKRIFAQVTDGSTGFMGLDTYASFKQMYDTVSLALSSDSNLEPNFNEMIALLRKRENSTPWMKPLIERLEQADDQVKNQFVYNTYKQKVYAKFATLTFDNDGGVNSNIYDSNSNEAKRAVVDRWRENFKRAPINKEGKIDTKVLNKVVEEWNSWFDSGTSNQSDTTYKNWLSNFGIELSDSTFTALRNGELNISEGGGKLKKARFKDLFEGLTGSSSKNRTGLLFTNLMKYSLMNKDKQEVEFYDNIKNHPFEDMNTILSQLAELEVKYNPSYGSTSRYISGKSVTEIESFNYFYEQFKKLKSSSLSEDKAYLKDLENLSFSQDSFLLKMLKEDDVFANQFGHGLVDLMSLKELYKKSPMFAGIDELSSIDYMFAQRAMFQNRNQGAEKEVIGLPFEVRMAHMNTLTNSDKGRMMLLKTAVFDFYKQSEAAFEINEEGDIKFKEDLNNLLYDNLVVPELRRMVNFITNVKNTNIKGYDKGAVRFNLIPGINTLTDKKGRSVSELISVIEGKSQEEIMENVKEIFGADISTFIQDNVIKEALDNVKDLNQFNSKIDGFNNAEYLKQRKGTVDENMKIAELDFILNSMLTNMNYMQLMTGDPALYYKSKGDVKSKDLKAQTKISQQLAINLGKRMASMIAPGSVLADSNNNSYLQVFLEDVNGVADNILDIVEWHYSKKELNEKHGNGLTYKEMFESSKKGNREFIDLLSERFERVAEFIDIESTDAQEYTTLNEHIYVMLKQGRISEDKYKTIQDKIKKEEDLTKEELDLVLQPIKPVYTGTIYDSEQDVNRMMYIKSSSFPLIPQLTKGRKLDDLRKNMEEVEKVYSTTVRASYQTANKVGALTSENTIKDFSQPIVDNNIIKLERAHFKIQQDVPFKSKKVQDDTVSMGTQIFKLLMGDGIMDIDGFEFEGQEYNGKELQNKFHEIFKDMVSLKRDKFLDSLGLNADMSAKDPKETIKKLQKLLIKEAKSRGFSKQDLKILSLVDNGQGEMTFKLPLWLTGNSNKYESMLNALINNKIFKQKLPGNKFVTGSEAGFDVSETTEGIDESRIIHVGDFEGGVLQSTRKQDKSISKAQILVPSKFKLNGELINLFEEFNGEEGLYIQKVDGIVRIKEDMFDKNLLEQFVFRIPTSSHGLGSSVEVVGFLPPESGDLIITPKGFIAQMGQDFDIDSLTAYQYNHVVMQDGAVKELTEENKEAYLTEVSNRINYLEQLVKEDKLDIYNNLLSSIPGLNLEDLNKEDILEELAIAKKSISKEFDLKLLENKFIKVHNSVYSNEKSQKHINKVLSMVFAEKQADEIESLTENTSNTFNILSPKYQMIKMNAGSTGQDAIGIYAKGVTLHSLVQQAKSSGTKVGLGTKDQSKQIRIGNLVSDGSLGNMLAIPSKNQVFKGLTRRISTILDERTNTGTDNEKAQILGRTGLNHKDAIAVDNLLSLLGFDAEYTQITKEDFDKDKAFHRSTNIDGKEVYYTEHSVPYLLHSQPIVKEFFSIINDKESITTEFSARAKQEAINELLSKYGKKEQDVYKGKLGIWQRKGDKDIFVSEQDNTKFNAQMLQNQIVLNSQADKNSQLEILAIYLDLIDEAKKVKTMMQHVDLNNLGKSMWESGTKAKDFKEFFTNLDSVGITGAEALVGDITERGETLEEGQIDLGDGLVLTPTTNQGVMVGTALSLSESLFTNLFPAKNKYINSIIENIFKEGNLNTDNSFAVIKAKEQVFQEIKKYLTSAEGLGIFNKSTKEVREDLYLDRFNENHLSLSSYVGNLFNSESNEYANGLRKVKNNLFLNNLKYNVGENGKPSLITFNNQESFEANQEAIYSSFKELISEDLSLPRKNGEFFSTRLLAQELIAYSYSSGGIVQGALEFHKFLPIEYLDDMTYKNKKGQDIPISARLRSYNTFNRVEGNQNILGRFTRQYFQNNPESLVQMEMKEVTLGNEVKIYTPKENTSLAYIANKVKTKSKLKQDRWKIFEKIEGEKYYKEIDVLGETGMAEYEFGVEELTSNLGKDKTPVTKISSLELDTINDENLGIIPKNGSEVSSFLKAIATGEYGDYSNIKDIAQYLVNFVPEGKTFNYKEGNFKGRFREGEIFLNLDRIENNSDLAVTFMHEAVHSLTSPYINQYLDEFGELTGNAPSELIGLNNVLNEYKNKLKAKDVDKYVNFANKWAKYKKDLSSNIPSNIEFTQEEIGIYYPTVNLKEFVATALGNNKEFKAVAGDMQYLETKGSILRKFGHFISQLIKRIGKTEGIKEDSIALQAIARSLDLVEIASKTKKQEQTPVEEAPQMSKEEVEQLNKQYQNEPGLFEDTSGDNLDLEGPYKGTDPSTSLLPLMKITKNKCK